MVYVALAEAVALVLTISMFGALLRWKERAHSRREDLILNKLLHSVGRTWTPPPAAEAAADDEDDPSKWRTWTTSPEQEPVY